MSSCCICGLPHYCISGQRRLCDLSRPNCNMLCNSNPEAIPGRRGYLIGFDMAKSPTKPSNLPGQDARAVRDAILQVVISRPLLPVLYR
ncbi:hypothetical protein OE88DRAFT_931257 [Heliocybe sulcata]|uniref:Uncharacterized protein n=1 Tax=Heliocybe sulcata TaxID=5364 RepID=A0A5C3NLT7_9AGAM|nr:hypothetical protein OE88DRAFT_931257 [Heliocybe sulcata]